MRRPMRLRNEDLVMSSSKFSQLLVGIVILALSPRLPGQNDKTSVKPAPAANAPQSSGAAPSPATRTPEPNPATAWEMLTRGASSDKFRDRSDAVSALTILDHDRKAIAIISFALDDKEESVRMLAATSLGDMKARSAIPKLKVALDDRSPQVAFAAAQALWKMGDRSGRGVFYDVLVGERKVKPGPVKSKIQQARMDMHDPKALALIGVNEASGVFLGPFSMGVSMVEEYAKDGGVPVQALCAQLLASDDIRATVDQLVLALGDKNWAVRAAAAKSLAKLDDRGALPQLKDMMLTDKSQPARLVAAAAVIRLSRPLSSPSTPRLVY